MVPWGPPAPWLGKRCANDWEFRELIGLPGKCYEDDGSLLEVEDALEVSTCPLCQKFLALGLLAGWIALLKYFEGHIATVCGPR